MSRILTIEDFSQGGGGTIAITTATAYTDKKLYMLRVDADCVFDEIEINGESADVRTNYIDSAGATIPAGAWIVAGGTNYFSKIDLGSGKVTGFKLPNEFQ